MADESWKCYADGPYVVTEWSGQTTRKLCKPKNVGKANEVSAEQQAIKEAKAKRAKRAKKDAIAVKPMLAQTFCPERFVPGSTVQPKLDGVRCLAYWVGDRVVLQSRGGDDYPVEHVRAAIEKTLPKGAILDGELYIHGVSLQTIVSLVKRPQEGSERLEYWVYDMVKRDLTWEQRLVELAEIEFYHPVRPIPMTRASSEAIALRVHKSCVDGGFEGSIVRSPVSIYGQGKRSWGLMKLKNWRDAEFEIVGWKLGEGNYSGIPIFRCKCDAGEFDCNPPGNLEERRALLAKANDLVGRQLTVKFFDYTDAGLPHFPVGVAIREDGQ